MISAPKSPDEDARLEALRQYHVLDTVPEESFDDFTKLASLLCEAPISLISLIDSDRQWFKSKVGIDADETHRDLAFCGHAILESEDLLVVPNALEDERFLDNPLVSEAPHIRFYAGAPLVNTEGFALGTLCVIDRVPRVLSEDQRTALSTLGRRLVAHLENRKVSHSLAMALENISSLEKLLPICSHCRRVRDDQGYWAQVEEYIRRHLDTEFTHGICPDCVREHFPDVIIEEPNARDGGAVA